MAAIVFLVAILGLLFAGRTQARAVGHGSKPLFRFQLWQLALALALPIVCAAFSLGTESSRSGNELVRTET